MFLDCLCITARHRFARTYQISNGIAANGSQVPLFHFRMPGSNEIYSSKWLHSYYVVTSWEIM
jgi:hypothetical protein